MPWSALIGAAASLGGGLLDANSARASNNAARANLEQQTENQRQFAQHSLEWRAGDAMRAYERYGIHPLAMLGVQGATYTPTSVNFTPSGMGDSVARAGQDISRGIMAGADRRLRADALKLQEVQLNNAAERGALENEVLRIQIASMRARLGQQSMPGVPEGTIGHPGVERNIIPDVSVARTPRGGYVVLPSEAAQQRMEDIFGLGPEWFARNRAWLATQEARDWVKGYLPKPPNYKEWRYQVPTGEWLPQYVDYPDRHLPSRVKSRQLKWLRNKGVW